VNARGAFDDADAELRRLIREGLMHGIPGEQLTDALAVTAARLSDRDGRR
jgi:hypothetical protein